MSDLDGLWKTHSCKGILLHKEAGCLKKKKRRQQKNNQGYYMYKCAAWMISKKHTIHGPRPLLSKQNPLNFMLDHGW